MKLTFIGTGAADWKLSEKQGNEFFRRLTSIRVDDDLMIDCSPDTRDYVENENVSLKGVKDLLITHSHGDHYSSAAITDLLDKDVKIWAEEKTAEVISAQMPQHDVRKIDMFKAEKVGDYGVITIPANHVVADINQTPVHYIIEKGDKKIFWGCDAAWFLCRSWHEIKKHKYDLIVLDGTLGDDEGDYRIFEHNNLRMICEMVNTMRSEGLIKENGKVMISHMARYAHKSHEELVKDMSRFGIEVAFDGMEIEI